MQNREGWSGYESKIRKKSFFLSMTFHIGLITFLTLSSFKTNWKNEVFVVQMVNIPTPVVVKPVKKNTRVKKQEKIKKVVVKKEKVPSFNVEQYKKRLLKEIDIKNQKVALNKNEKIEKVNIPSLSSTKLDLRNVKLITDIPSWYILLLKNKIEENWRFKNTIGELSVTVSFRIYKNGEIKNIRVEKSSGYRPFDRSAILAVKSTKDIPAFPEEIKENYLDIIIEFKKEA